MVYELHSGAEMLEVIRFNNLLFKVVSNGVIDVHPEKDMRELITLLQKDQDKNPNAVQASSSSSQSKASSSNASEASSSAPSSNQPQQATNMEVNRTTPFDELVTRYRQILDRIEDRLKGVEFLERNVSADKEKAEREIQNLRLQIAASKASVSPSSSSSTRVAAARRPKK